MVGGAPVAQSGGMTTTPPGGEPSPPPRPGATTGQPGADPSERGEDDQGPRVGAADVRDLGRMRRTVGPDRYVAGVGGGLARHLDVDPVVVRVALAVLAFFGGAGLLLYGVAWLVVPEDGAERARLSLDARSRTVALAGTGVLATLALLGDTLGGDWFPWPLALVALLVFLVVTRRDRRATPPPPPYGPPPGAYGPRQPYGPPPGPYGPRQPYGPPPAAYGPPRPPGPPPATGWSPPPPAAPLPRHPRRRGPRLFPATLAAIALAVGVLGVIDVAGTAVAPAAYPAIALGVTALALLLASVWGRGGGLIALGLLCALVLGGTSAADQVEGEHTVFRPTSASDVQPRYELGIGEMELDLSEVEDLEALDGRTIALRADLGAIEVILPDDMDADATARTNGPGGLTIFGQDTGGVDASVTAQHDGGADVPRLSIDAEVGVGEIVVRTR